MDLDNDGLLTSSVRNECLQKILSCRRNQDEDLKGRINVLTRSDCGRAPLYGIAQTMSVNILEDTVHGMASRWHPWAVTGTSKSILESD